jgi:predicted DNA binding CopG/RHH family protein
VLSRLDRIESTINKIEKKLIKFDKLADENDALWQMLDEQREMDQIFVNSAEDYNREIAEILLRNTKVQGDA